MFVGRALPLRSGCVKASKPVLPSRTQIVVKARPNQSKAPTSQLPARESKRSFKSRERQEADSDLGEPFFLRVPIANRFAILKCSEYAMIQDVGLAA